MSRRTTATNSEQDAFIMSERLAFRNPGASSPRYSSSGAPIDTRSYQWKPRKVSSYPNEDIRRVMKPSEQRQNEARDRERITLRGGGRGTTTTARVPIGYTLANRPAPPTSALTSDSGYGTLTGDSKSTTVIGLREKRLRNEHTISEDFSDDKRVRKRRLLAFDKVLCGDNPPSAKRSPDERRNDRHDSPPIPPVTIHNSPYAEESRTTQAPHLRDLSPPVTRVTDLNSDLPTTHVWDELPILSPTPSPRGPPPAGSRLNSSWSDFDPDESASNRPTSPPLPRRPSRVYASDLDKAATYIERSRGQNPSPSASSPPPSRFKVKESKTYTIGDVKFSELPYKRGRRRSVSPNLHMLSHRVSPSYTKVRESRSYGPADVIYSDSPYTIPSSREERDPEREAAKREHEFLKKERIGDEEAARQEKKESEAEILRRERLDRMRRAPKTASLKDARARYGPRVAAREMDRWKRVAEEESRFPEEHRFL